MKVAPWWWEIVDLLPYISLDQEAETGLEIRLVINPKAYPSPDPQSLRMPPPAGSQVSKWKSVGDILPPHYMFLNYFRISEF